MFNKFSKRPLRLLIEERTIFQEREGTIAYLSEKWWLPVSTPYENILFRWIIDFNVKAKVITTSEENKWEWLHDLSVNKDS